MHSKIIHLDTHFNTGEATVQPVLLWANGRPQYEGITKHASVNYDYFKTITPIPGHSIVYVIALGSWEYYGENRNGDSFPEAPYKEHENPPWISVKDTLINNYKSFEQYGYNYRHHVNKDPKKAVGKVMKAFWNDTMHRVELLIDLEDAKAPDLAERIASGEYPPVSMGTRVPYDVCSICGNRAPTRKQYCDHLKFNMRGVIDGKKISALNPSPKFFDISWVFRPADRTAFMLKKVAEDSIYELSGSDAGEYIQRMNQYKQAAHKIAVIDKIVQGYPVDSIPSELDSNEIQQLTNMRSQVLDSVTQTPDLPDAILQQLAQHDLGTVLTTAQATGQIQLTTPEFVKMVTFKTNPQINLTPRMLDKLVVLQQSILSLLTELPQITQAFVDSGVFNTNITQPNQEVLACLLPYMEKRSGMGEYLKRRFIPDQYRTQVPEHSRLLTITDPGSGQKYQTNTGAAIRAHDEIAKRNIYKTIGGGGLLAGAYKVINAGSRSKVPYIRPISALTLGALGLANIPSMGEHYMTDQGIPIPKMTELTKMSASFSQRAAVPLLSTLGIMAGLSHDYKSRLNSPIPLNHPGLPLSRRLLDQVGEFSFNHPLLSAAGGTFLGMRVGQSPLGQSASKWVGQKIKNTRGTVADVYKSIQEGVKLSAYIAPYVSPSTSTVLLPELDIDKIAEFIGYLIVED